MQNPSSPRILFNWDGGPLAFGEYPMSKEEFLGYIFDPFEGSHVDAILWCTGDTVLDVPSRMGNTEADLSVESFSGSPSSYRRAMNARHLIERGEEPLKIITQEAHRRGMSSYASFRLNDVHDSIPFRDKSVDTNKLAPIKRENPHWMLGHERRKTLPTAFDYGQREVRDWWLERVCEPYEKYDLDGIELDFCRQQCFFADRQEYRHRYLLTDWLARVRERLTELGAKRGRPITVAVRVDETLEACHLDGFDLEEWIEQELFDILILGTGTIEYDLERFGRVVADRSIADRPIAIYPCIYGWAYGQAFGPKPIEEIRAEAARHWLQGADGLYCFNMFPVVDQRWPEQCVSPATFREIGDPLTLEGKDKCYQVCKGRTNDEYYPYNDLWGMLPLELHTTYSGVGPNLRVFVADDIENAQEAGKLAKLQLRCRFQNVSPTDACRFILNGRQLDGPSRTHPLAMKAHGTTLVDAAGQEWQTLDIPPKTLRRGWNEVGIGLLERTALRVPLKLAEVQITVTYSKDEA